MMKHAYVSSSSLFGDNYPVRSATTIVTQGAEELVKNIVNTVYFDPGFTYAGGQALMDQVYNKCMGIKQWKPLK
jgi:hypothetical protein